jgi:hypothetical protein
MDYLLEICQGRSEVWVRPWQDQNVAPLPLFFAPPSIKGGVANEICPILPPPPPR